MHRVAELTYADNGRNRQEGGDPSRDCTNS
jgi:hypothetical protein